MIAITRSARLRGHWCRYAPSCGSGSVAGQGAALMDEQACRRPPMRACLWAIACVWPFAAFASCQRLEPRSSKRSGSLATSAKRLLEHAGSASSTRHRLLRSRPTSRGRVVGGHAVFAACNHLGIEVCQLVAEAIEAVDAIGQASEPGLALDLPVEAQSALGSGRSAIMCTLALGAPNRRRRRNPGASGDGRPARCSSRTARQARCESA